MNKFYLIYLVWLLPLYFLVMHTYQWITLNGAERTYEEGESYVAEVIDFDVKQIAAQTSGYIVLAFDTNEGEEIEQRLSLSVQMAQAISDAERIPIRYLSDSPQDIVIMNTYSLQRNVIRVNLAVTMIGLITGLIIAFYASRYAKRRIRDGEPTLRIERTDRE